MPVKLFSILKKFQASLIIAALKNKKMNQKNYKRFFLNLKNCPKKPYYMTKYII